MFNKYNLARCYFWFDDETDGYHYGGIDYKIGIINKHYYPEVYKNDQTLEFVIVENFIGLLNK